LSGKIFSVFELIAEANRVVQIASETILRDLLKGMVERP
jgi:hypothetical protein